MEGSGAVTVSVEVGAPAPGTAPGIPSSPSTPSTPSSVTSPPLAATGAPVDVLVGGAFSLILLGAVAVAAARTRLEHFRA